MICIVFLSGARMPTRKIDNLLSLRQRSGFTRLLARAFDRDAWTAQLRAFLPSELRSACQVANVRDHLLTVHILNAAWATRFRFLIPDLLPRINRLADFAAVREIRVKVVPEGSAAPSDAHPVDRAPPDSQALRALADTLEYGELKDAILRLARHGEAAAQPPGTG
jgi:hypothetical protein